MGCCKSSTVPQEELVDANLNQRPSLLKEFYEEQRSAATSSSLSLNRLEANEVPQNTAQRQHDKYHNENTLVNAADIKIHKYREDDSGDIYGCIQTMKHKLASHEQVLALLQELRNVNYKRVVEVKEYFDTQMSYWIITEWSRGATLQKAMGSQNFTLDDIKTICKLMLRTLLAMHTAGEMHMHLSPHTVMVHKQDKWHLKIMPVALVKIQQLCSERKDIHCYQAPEVVLEKEADSKADVWSVGLITLEMVLGNSVIKGSLQDVRAQFLSQKAKWQSVIQDYVKNGVRQPALAELLLGMLRFEPGKRTSVEEALGCF